MMEMDSFMKNAESVMEMDILSCIVRIVTAKVKSS